MTMTTTMKIDYKTLREDVAKKLWESNEDIDEQLIDHELEKIIRNPVLLRKYIIVKET